MMRSAPAAAGFTLLELLVAMTVLGVLTGLLAGGLSFGTRVWERQRGRLEAATDLQIAQDVLRRTLTQATPIPTAGDEADPEPSFVGSETDVQFIGPPPAQSLAGGLFDYDIFVEGDPPGQHLVLHWKLRTPDGKPAKRRVTNAAPGPEEAMLDGRQTTLLEHVESVQFAYFGADQDNGAAQWSTSWRSPDKLPQLIRVRLTFTPGDPRVWPELLVTPKISLSAVQ